MMALQHLFWCVICFRQESEGARIRLQRKSVDNSSGRLQQGETGPGLQQYLLGQGGTCPSLPQVFQFGNSKRIRRVPKPAKGDEGIYMMHPNMSYVSKQSVGQVLFLWPTDDHNGFFKLEGMLCARLFCWVQRRKNVEFRPVHSVQHARKILDEFYDKGLTDVVIGGHGWPNGLVWGRVDLKAKSSPVLTNSKTLDDIIPGTGKKKGDVKGWWKETKGFLQHLRRKLPVGGSLILHSCLTAGESLFEKTGATKNFFTFVAGKLPGRTVLGAKCPVRWPSNPLLLLNASSQCVSADELQMMQHADIQGWNYGPAVHQVDRPDCKELEEDNNLLNKYQYCLSGCGEKCPNWTEELEDVPLTEAEELSCRRSVTKVIGAVLHGEDTKSDDLRLHKKVCLIEYDADE